MNFGFLEHYLRIEAYMKSHQSFMLFNSVLNASAVETWGSSQYKNVNLPA